LDKENNISENQVAKTGKTKIDEAPPAPPKKPPKIEDKPFIDFINENLIPGIRASLAKHNVNLTELSFSKTARPVTEDICWVVFGELSQQRRFWLSFSTDKITSIKTISLAESGAEPSLIESFLIDERKITLSLLISRLLQRLNGQKWIGPN